MATLTEYIFNINLSFPNQMVDSGSLKNEIQSSSIIISIDSINTEDGYTIIIFKDALSSEDEITLNNLVSNHSGTSPEIPLTITSSKVNSEGIPLYTNQPRVGDEVIYASNNFCDKSTWYNGSIRVENEVLTNVDNYQFTSLNSYWIDMISGRVLDDDGVVSEQIELNPENPHGYKVIIKIDGVEKIAREPFESSGGDYEIFFEDGYIKFFEEVTGTITASYSYASSSIFILAPLPGKILSIEGAEADFSSDVTYNDTIFYTVYGYVDVFAPEYLDTNGGPYPSGTKIPLKTEKYKRYVQILREAVGAYPTLDANCSSEEHKLLSNKEFRRVSRGLKNKSTAIPFRYGTIRSLSSATGMELHVGLEHDRVFDGESSTVTFYCTSNDE